MIGRRQNKKAGWEPGPKLWNTPFLPKEILLCVEKEKIMRRKENSCYE